MPRLLLADDSATVRALAVMELRSAGYDVIEATDGAQAVELALAENPDVILMDVEMPEMDGYTALEKLKTDERTSDIPVVFLTGRVQADDVVKGLEMGAHDYVRKPPEPGELLARVSAALRVKQLQDELKARMVELEQVSRTDYLTGLHNRRHIEEQLRMSGAGARRHGYPMAVLLLDVDHFKRVNDTLGHSAGDAVLVEVSRRLKAQLRTEDLLGRWGGEEFLLLLQWTSAASAGILAERLRKVVASTPVVVDGVEITVTISVGGAAADAPGEHELLALADAELYAAKDAGRNQVRVVVSHP